MTVLIGQMKITRGFLLYTLLKKITIFRINVDITTYLYHVKHCPFNMAELVSA